MKKSILKICFLFAATTVFSQAGHIMQGAGALNMSMGGAATGNALDITGALQWNPASISAFDENILKFDIGLFFSSPELSSSFDAGAMWPADFFGVGSPASQAVSGMTADDRGISPMPAFAMVWGSADSKHTFGASAIGISGFGVTFPEEINTPSLADGSQNTSWDPSANSNAINYPQAANGFGRVESDYILLQIGFTWAYELSDKFSIGIEPTFNYSTLQLMPNPTAGPNDFGYPSTDKASATGFGGQVGMYFDSGTGFSAGASYKTNIGFSDFEFANTYPDNSNATSNFNMDFPAILSFGVGYSTEIFDIAVDYRSVDYENTEGFAESGWVIADSGPGAGFPTGEVAGFGWKNITIISAGIQYKGIDKMPLRVGYTNSTNPITNELAFFSVPATAIIKNAFQFGLTYIASDKLSLDVVYHHGASDGATTGSVLSPRPFATDQDMNGFPDGPWSTDNLLGVIPGSEVSYEMTTDLVMVGVSFKLGGSSE